MSADVAEHAHTGSTPFIVARDPAGPLPGLPAPVVAIGNFDGLHAGHRAVTDRAVELARANGRRVAILTFDPHPRRYFRPDLTFFRLTPPRVLARLALDAGLDGLITLTFDAALARHSAAEFIEHVLVARLGVSGVAVGDDFRFGADRGGDSGLLLTAGERLGFQVAVAAGLMQGAQRVSSSAIRAALVAGDVAQANRLLGYRWFVIGEVVHGAKLGRTLGFPTANLALEPDCGLRHGIYAVTVTVDGVVHQGVASFGRRPTFDDGAPLLESYLFDFAGDLYGRTIAVSFVGFLRSELKFDGAEALIAQMHRDADAARVALRHG